MREGGQGTGNERRETSKDISNEYSKLYLHVNVISTWFLFPLGSPNPSIISWPEMKEKQIWVKWIYNRGQSSSEYAYELTKGECLSHFVETCFCFL